MHSVAAPALRGGGGAVTVGVRDEVARSVHPPTVGLVAQFVVLTVLVVGADMGFVGWLAGSVYALATWTLLSQALDRSGIGRWGPADSVTLARATLVGGAAALVADSFVAPVALPILVGAAAAALVLDAVDGQVARRTGTTSRLGARFDMETDAFLVLVLSVFVAGSLGWWVLAIGLPRYAFGAAAQAWPWLRGSLPERRSRKSVAAAQGTVLVVASAAVVPVPVMVAVVVSTLALLGWSFARDIAWLWRYRPRGARVP